MEFSMNDQIGKMKINCQLLIIINQLIRRIKYNYQIHARQMQKVN